ncbi:alpha/beta fold hydrolase [Aliikangiella maris]|uniref:Alpha/beta fold hydrolase n=2 Tax=Aliikangiella maris TaxID=3162458 RepID=A0ABV2BW01_9GAMM
MKIVLVHGIFNRGAIFFWLKKYLKQAGFNCFSPSLRPCDGRYGIDYTAEQLADKIQSFVPGDEKFCLIGFSMGAVVARYYLQNLGGYHRVTHFFSIAGPHHGSYWAYLPYPSKGVRQLRPGSDFLSQLAANQSILKKVKVYSYWTPFDLSILPSNSSIWSIANNQKVNAWSHFSIIFNRAVKQHILTELINDSP